MADLLRAYWRIPPWLRLTGILAVTIGVGLAVDSGSPLRHHVNILYLLAVLTIGGLVAEAERRHRTRR